MFPIRKCVQMHTAEVQILHLNITYSNKNICTVYVFYKTEEKISKPLGVENEK